MFIAVRFPVYPLRQERNVIEHSKVHCAPLERRAVKVSGL